MNTKDDTNVTGDFNGTDSLRSSFRLERRSTQEFKERVRPTLKKIELENDGEKRKKNAKKDDKKREKDDSRKDKKKSKSKSGDMEEIDGKKSDKKKKSKEEDLESSDNSDLRKTESRFSFRGLFGGTRPYFPFV